MSDTIRATLAAYLQSIGVTYTATHTGEQTRDNNWKCDGWRVTLTRAGRNITTDYYTGTGHRKQVQRMPSPAYRRGTLAYEAWERTAFKPQTPDAAGVLHSLLLDGEAINQSFSDWCADFGYDEDSRKALDTYDACCAIGKELRAFFSAEEREALREMLQDY